MSETIKDVITILNKMDSRLNKMEDKFENIESRLDILENSEKYEKPAFKDFANEDLEFGDTLNWLIRMKTFAKEAKAGIMENFNFVRVQNVMEFLNWEWGFTENGVPTVEEIKETVEQYLDELIDKAWSEALEGVTDDSLVYEAGVSTEKDAIYSWTIDTGGFNYTIAVFDNSDVRLSVKFVVEDYEDANNIDLL